MRRHRHSTRPDWHVIGRDADGIERYRITGYGSRLEAQDTLPFHPRPGGPGFPRDAGPYPLLYTVESLPWRCTWHDGTGQTGPTTRDRVAYLLRAARSRRPYGDRIERTAEGYRIGLMALSRPPHDREPRRYRIGRVAYPDGPDGCSGVEIIRIDREGRTVIGYAIPEPDTVWQQGVWCFRPRLSEDSLPHEKAIEPQCSRAALIRALSAPT